MKTFESLNDHDSNAFHRRHRAYHEVGHLWALNSLGLHVPWASLNDYVSVVSPLPGAMDWASAVALSLHAVCVEVDILTDLNANDLTDVDPVSCREHALDLINGDCFCMRGGDHQGKHLIESPDYMEPIIARLLTNWRGIDSLADLLFAGYKPSAAVIQKYLAMPGPRIRESAQHRPGSRGEWNAPG